jgi:hypothetical protein
MAGNAVARAGKILAALDDVVAAGTSLLLALRGGTKKERGQEKKEP